VSIALGVAVGIIGFGLNGLQAGRPNPWPLWYIPAILQLIAAWPGFALTVKRGHDRGRSAWWTLTFNIFYHVIPLGLLITHRREGAVWVTIVLGLYFLMDYGLFDGAQGPNQYGPSPKGLGTEHAQANFSAP
jgi:uncharacterized membrane protein YhaH (DUF805 family)